MRNKLWHNMPMDLKKFEQLQQHVRSACDKIKRKYSLQMPGNEAHNHELFFSFLFVIVKEDIGSTSLEAEST